jgi:hypothetical protein
MCSGRGHGRLEDIRVHEITFVRANGEDWTLGQA